MKTKIFFLLATMLLTSMCAFAQSGNNGTLKGDVNGDGVVDVADINAVIEIMKNGGGTGEETKDYWYAGQVQPQDMSSNPTVDDTNFTVDKWHTLGTATTIAKRITGGTSGNDWYVAVPTSINLKPTAGDLSTPDTSWDNLGTITVNEVSYTIWRTNSTEIVQAVYMAGTGEETKYYFYVGTEKPTSLSQASVVESYLAEQTYTNNSGAKSHIFVLTNSDKNVTFINLATGNPIDQNEVDTTTISGYKIFETAVGTANTGTIKIRIS